MTAFVGNTRYRTMVNGNRVNFVTTKLLPYDAEVQYLEATGTQYINTGIKPNNTYTFDCKVAVTQDLINCVYWGVRTSGTYSSNNSQCYLNSNNTTSSNVRDKHLRLITTNSSSEFNWNSGIIPTANTMYELTGIVTVSTMLQMQYPVTLFALNNIGSITPNLGLCRIGYWKAYSNGQVVCDMIPVRIGTTGYMYDKVSKQLFGNLGTGDFNIGPDKT